MKICFYTEGHIGDLLITLPFIDLLIKKYSENDYYQFVHGNMTLFDDSLITSVNRLSPSDSLCGDINIPTWMCNSEYSGWTVPPEYILEDHFSIMKFYWKRIYEKYGFDIQIPDNLGINFEYNISTDSKKSVSLFCQPNKTKILVFNQKVKSSQTDNEDWKSYIVRVSNLFPNVDFFYTNEEDIDPKLVLNNNLYYTPDIFGQYKCDILYNSYLSTYCSIIVGRCNGPFMFASMHNNIVSSKDKTIISQINNNCHKDDLEIFYNRKVYKAKNIHSRTSKQTFDELENLLCQ
jgi:hypothetical protein